MVAVSMVDGKEMESVGLELARALGANPAVGCQRTLAIGLTTGLRQTSGQVDEIGALSGGLGAAVFSRSKAPRHARLILA